MNYKIPSFKITSRILKKEQEIIYILGQLEGIKLSSVPFRLRKESKIQSIYSSLAIEGNRLSIEQVAAILEGKMVLGPQKDILEVTNAIKIYKNLAKWNPLSLESLLEAHAILMDSLIIENGRLRNGEVGIFQGDQVIHVAPSAKIVPELMNKLFAFLNTNKYHSWIIKACVFHYQFEFIHPFSDGNGRMGRLWQQVILMKQNTVFENISVEQMIKNTQSKYYKVLDECSRSGNCTSFVEYSLNQILATLKKYLKDGQRNRKMTVEEKLQYAKEKLQGQKNFQRKEYMDIFKDISSSTATRDLEFGVKNNILKRTGNNSVTEYEFIS